jgi:hypothetical protein
LLASYGLLIGTAVLLFSWIVEKNQAAHWDQKLAELTELRTHTSLELILAQSNAIFLTRKAETHAAVLVFETNKDILNAFSAYKQLVNILSRKLPPSYQEGLALIKEMLNQILGEYTKDYEDRGDRSLSEAETVTVTNLYTQIQALISVGEGALSTEVFYQAGVDRLQTLKRITQVLDNHKDYDQIFKSMDRDMKTFADSIYSGKPAATNVSALIDRLYSITQEAIKDVHIFATDVARKKYRYAFLYKFSYIFGTLLVLGSMITKTNAVVVSNE